MPTREQVALKEVGRTTITHAGARVLAGAFLVTLLAVPLVQTIVDCRLRTGQREEARFLYGGIFRDVVKTVRAWPELSGSFFRRAYHFNARCLSDIHRYEDDVDNHSWLARTLLGPTQYGLTAVLGVGNEQAYPGRNRWLFYRPDVDYITGPGFLDHRALKRRMGYATEWRAPPQTDAVRAIVQFRDQLKPRGIDLILLPTPGKAVIHPEQFVRLPASAAPLQNPSYDAFLRALQNAGLLVVDLSDELTTAARAQGRTQFLATDTHWRPEVVERAAQKLADFIARHVPLPTVAPAAYSFAQVEHTGQGDVAVMLKLPPKQQLYPAEPVRLRQIRTPRDELWSATQEADVLLLGDSFSNIFSLEAMGWGESAGLAEQLSFVLQRPLDRIVINDQGAHATRAALAHELARGRDRLSGKRLVIWQFAQRELASGDWKLLAMDVVAAPSSRFVAPEPGSALRVRGRVASIAPVPRPGSVPYRDHVTSVHLVDVEDETGALKDEQALVYVLSMRDNQWTAAARWRPGDRLSLKLRAWSDVAGQFEGLNRSEPEDPELQLQEPAWGESWE